MRAARASESSLSRPRPLVRWFPLRSGAYCAMPALRDHQATALSDVKSFDSPVQLGFDRAGKENAAKQAAACPRRAAPRPVYEGDYGHAPAAEGGDSPKKQAQGARLRSGRRVFMGWSVASEVQQTQACSGRRGHPAALVARTESYTEAALRRSLVHTETVIAGAHHRGRPFPAFAISVHAAARSPSRRRLLLRKPAMTGSARLGSPTDTSSVSRDIALSAHVSTQSIERWLSSRLGCLDSL